jgi:hypothetical protein
MTRIILNDVLRNALPNLSEPLELCDESGKVVAKITPVVDLSEYEGLEPPELSPEELKRRKTSEKWYTTAEFLKHLESM